MAHLAASPGGEVHERLFRRRPDAAAPIPRRLGRVVAALAITSALAGCLSEDASSDGASIDDDGRRLQLTIDDPRVEFARHVPVVVTLEGAPWPEGARIDLLIDGEVRATTQGPGPSWFVELPIRDERDDGQREVIARASPLQSEGPSIDSNEVALDVDVPPGGTIVSQVTLDDPCWPRTVRVEGERVYLTGQFDDVVRGKSCVLVQDEDSSWIEFPRRESVPYGPVMGARLRPDVTPPWAPSAPVVEVIVHASVLNLLDDSRVARFLWTTVPDPSSGSPFVGAFDLSLGDSRVPEQVWFTEDGDSTIVGWGRDEPEVGGPFRGMLARVSSAGDVRWNRTWPGPTPDTGEIVFFGAAPLRDGGVATLSRSAGVFEVLVWSSDGELRERFPVPGVGDIFEPGGFSASSDGTLFAVAGEIAPMYANDTELTLVFDREGSRYGSTRPSRDRTTARGVTLTEDSAVFLRAHDCTLGDLDIGELVDCTLEVEVRALDGELRWLRSFETLTPTGLGARGGDNGAAMFVDRDGYVWIAASAHLPTPIEGFDEGFVWLTKLHP